MPSMLAVNIVISCNLKSFVFRIFVLLQIITFLGIQLWIITILSYIKSFYIRSLLYFKIMFNSWNRSWTFLVSLRLYVKIIDVHKHPFQKAIKWKSKSTLNWFKRPVDRQMLLWHHFKGHLIVKCNSQHLLMSIGPFDKRG